MISVQEAEELIQKHCPASPIVEQPLNDVAGEILREDIPAERDHPPFHRVAMDGIAIRFEDWEQGTRQFPVVGCQRAGRPAAVWDQPQSCLEAMTGAPLPIGTDCVVPYEQVRIRDRVAVLENGLSLKRMQNIHQKSSDHKKGDILLQAGCRVEGPQMAVLASAGQTHVKIARRPRIVVISTGDELVDVGENLEDYQIRRSNSYALQTALLTQGFKDVSCVHFPDDRKQLEEALEPLLKEHDVFILSGGVSKGKFDFLPQVFEELNVSCLFHKVRQRPGKPFWFGLTVDQRPVFALPGNPVSALVCFQRFVLPQLLRSLGLLDQPQNYIELAQEVTFKKPLTYFLPVKQGFSVKMNGSGDYASLALSDGFVELDADRELFKKGESVRFFSWG